CYMATFLLVLLLQDASVRFIDLVGLGMGLGASFFVIGMHMQALDNTQNHGRDRFLYIGNLLNSLAGMVGPLVAGYLIQRFAGLRGYYFVFGLTVFWFVLATYVSFQLKGKPVSTRSHLWEVWRRPSREWRGMYWVTVGSGFVEGTYQTFLVTMMSFSILKSELGIGGFATFAGVIGLLANGVLAKMSRPERRLAIYSTGAVLLCASSVWIAAVPTFWVLVAYTVLSTLGMNLISTTFYAWTYASIEKDPEYANRRLDYIVVREIPLGVGRSAGIFFFLAMQWTVGVGASLGVTFALFGSVFMLMIPLVARIWRGERSSVKREEANVFEC
ncbi:MAG: MFS transporter, partial [Tumebacillaceae bacterium]